MAEVFGSINKNEKILIEFPLSAMSFRCGETVDSKGTVVSQFFRLLPYGGSPWEFELLVCENNIFFRYYDYSNDDRDH